MGAKPRSAQKALSYHLSLEGLGGRDLDECLEDLEQLVEEEILPPWFDRLPRE